VQPELEDRLRVELQIRDPIDPISEPACLVEAVRTAAAYRGFGRGEIGVCVCDDAEIRELNRVHLGHDFPTDVISFGYEVCGDLLCGELVTSIETARRRARRLQRAARDLDDSHRFDPWTVAAELSLYVVHGVLHITGMDDCRPPDRAEMRRAEHAVMTQLGWPQVQLFAVDGDVWLHRSEITRHRFATEERR
jgi:probable rRNA maturation factor